MKTIVRDRYFNKKVGTAIRVFSIYLLYSLVFSS